MAANFFFSSDFKKKYVSGDFEQLTLIWQKKKKKKKKQEKKGKKTTRKLNVS